MRDELRSWIETEKIMAADTTKLIPGAGTPLSTPEQQQQQPSGAAAANESFLVGSNHTGESNAPVAWEPPDFSFALLK